MKRKSWRQTPFIKFILFGALVSWCFAFSARAQEITTGVPIHPHPYSDDLPLQTWECSTPQVTAGTHMLEFRDTDGTVTGYVDCHGNISGSGGGSVSVNGNVVTSPNFNNTTPGAASPGFNLLWQYSSHSVSAYLPWLSSDALIQYAAPWGNDNNDGLTPMTPKYSIMGAYDALPNGGTIYALNKGTGTQLVSACKLTDPAGCGIWIMQGNDPNYASPPPGWRKERNWGVAIIGLAGVSANSFGHGDKVTVSAGGTDASHPALWYAGAHGFTFRNLSFSSCVPGRLGYDSTGALNSIWNTDIENVAFGTSGTVGCGPALALGGESAWDVIKDSQLNGNNAELSAITSVSRASNLVTVTATAALPTSWITGTNIGLAGVADNSFNGPNFVITVTGSNSYSYAQNGPDATSTGGFASSDAYQAIVANATGQPGSLGITKFSNDVLINGGMKFYLGADGLSLSIDNILQESSGTPVVDFAGCTVPTYASLDNISMADPYTLNIPAVRNDCPSNTNTGYEVRNVPFQGTEGPMTLLGGAIPRTGQNPIIQSASGIYNSYFIGQFDGTRRVFSPTFSPYSNLITTGPGPITGCSSPLTCVTITAPDGTNNATQISSTATSAIPYLYASEPVAVGDIFICGVWLYPFTGYSGNPYTPNNCDFVSSDATVDTAWDVKRGSPLGTGQEWDWTWEAFKVSYTSKTPGILTWGSNIYAGNSLGIYAPIVIRIPASLGLGENEAATIVEHLVSYRADALPGQISILPGEQFKADSTQLGTLASAPGCSATERGVIWDTWGATGIADSPGICEKNASDAYAWVAWGSGGGGSMVYPASGVANSTGLAWGTSYQVGTAANDLVQLNGSGYLPALNASLLTSYPYSSLTGAPTLAQTTAGVSHKWVYSYNASTGAFTQTQPVSSDLSDIATLNAATATALATPRAINGQNFDGTAAINVNNGATSGTVATNAGAGNALGSGPVSADILTYHTPATGIARTTSGGQTVASSELSGAVATSGSNVTTLAVSYRTASLSNLITGTGTSGVLQSGDDSDAANAVYNDSGTTRTITAVKCFTDSASNTTTINPTMGAAGTGTTILGGALTCGSSLTMSSSGSVSNANWLTGTGIIPVMGGTLTGTRLVYSITYTLP